MALFQRNPFVNRQEQPLFTLGMHKTLLIVGLGNIGNQYNGTRHNVGFACLDIFAQTHTFDTWTEKKDLKCQLASQTLGDARVILCKPTTMMNLSGEAVQAVTHFYKVPNESVLVVHDELDLPFGQIRARNGGGSAGNNGVASVIQHIGADFARIRVGISGQQRPSQMSGADYVLSKFTPEEQAHLPALMREVTSLITEYVFGGQLPHDTRSIV